MLLVSFVQEFSSGIKAPVGKSGKKSRRGGKRVDGRKIICYNECMFQKEVCGCRLFDKMGDNKIRDSQVMRAFCCSYFADG